MKNIFGTDGIRAKFNNSPLTTHELPKVAQAICNWIKSKYQSNSKVLIANDTRESCSIIKEIFINTLGKNNINVLDLGVLPTPSLFFLLNKSRNNNYTTGIVISASHNLYQDNGIKLIDYKTGKITEKDELFISSEFYKLIDINLEHKNKYKAYILQNFEHNFLKNIKIILDTANGATYKIAPEIFKELGAEVKVINNNPDGKNINLNCGATNTKQLEEEVIKSNADIGFAFDGDGDRVIAVNRLGKTKDGDDILALLLELPEYQNANTIVGTVMSNQGLEDYLKSKSIDFIRTSVGDKNILRELNKNNLPLGGEQSGHIILNNVISTGDGILVALKVLESVILKDNWELKTFKKYPQISKNIKVSYKRDLTSQPFCSIINNSKTKINNGRILVRYSGTEPLLRVMVEEKDFNTAIEIADILSKELCKELS